MKNVEWYFDFISPFAYLQSRRLDDFAQLATVRCKPILFAGLLNHWGQKGPAEIADKRLWTFEHVSWLAHKHGVPLRLPPAHPFVPLRLLRLAVLLDAPVDVVQHLFDFVWRDGKSPTDDDAFDQLLDQYNVSADELNSNDVKQALRQNTEEAIQRGVFGVPTCVVGEQKFWGYDATDMVHAALGDDPFYQSPQWLAARAMPDGVHRKEVA
jgi:2-hydroxychromene-2-carboxylate isomerase